MSKVAMGEVLSGRLGSWCGGESSGRGAWVQPAVEAGSRRAVDERRRTRLLRTRGGLDDLVPDVEAVEVLAYDERTVVGGAGCRCDVVIGGALEVVDVRVHGEPRLCSRADLRYFLW